MSVKSVVAGRLEKARSFADSLRSVYESAYSKATEVRKGGVEELIKDIQPRFRTAVEDGIHSAQAVLDEFNQSLADKAIPSFRKGAVSREQLDKKAKGVQSAETKAVQVKVNTPRAKSPGAKTSATRSAIARGKASKKAQVKK